MKQLDFVHVTIVVCHLTQCVVQAVQLFPALLVWVTIVLCVSPSSCVGHHCLVFWCVYMSSLSMSSACFSCILFSYLQLLTRSWKQVRRSAFPGHFFLYDIFLNS